MHRPIALARTVAMMLVMMVAIAPAQTLPSVPNKASLQDRVDRLAEQIHLRHRHHEPSLEKHRDAVAAVLTEWNRVSQSGDSINNRQQLASWLDAAMRAVMPGGSNAMPGVPSFEEPIAPITTIETLAPRATPEAIPPPIVAATPAKSATPRSQFSAPRSQQVPSQPRSAAKPVTPAAEPAVQPKPQRSKWSRNPSAAPLEWRDPFADDPSASPNPLRSGVRHKALRPTVRTARSVRIDLRQLAADIRGYNVALRELQATVLGLSDSDIFGLANAAEELGRLEERHGFLALYRSGLSVGRQAALPDSPPVQLVRELVLRKAAVLTQQGPPQQRDEQRALEELKERLARLSSPEPTAF